jgi:hypothetical protein
MGLLALDVLAAGDGVDQVPDSRQLEIKRQFIFATARGKRSLPPSGPDAFEERTPSKAVIRGR